jgi:drug/metabolite transporter superfamily protein YnfA
MRPPRGPLAHRGGLPPVTTATLPDWGFEMYAALLRAEQLGRVLAAFGGVVLA